MISVRARLCVMMFLQYFVWGAWGVALGGYMGSTLGFTGSQIGWVYSSTAIGAMLSPLFMGYVADRLLATEKLLGFLHLLGGGLLLYAAMSPDFSTLFGVMVAYAVCFMPTLALSNSISFENIGNPEQEFPLIRVFGTIGWIVAGAVVGFLLNGASNQPLYLAAATSFLLGAFCFLLPHTPPKGKPVASTEGRKSMLTLLADPSFLVFVLASFLICIPLAFYYSLANIFLGQIDAWKPTFLQTFGQMSEVFFMAAMPIFILRLGVKRMLALGMLAWVVRYFLFASLSFPLILGGILLHGICYDFFFVASQIYVDQKADTSQRASAQSFIAFITLGLGMFVGAQVAGYTMDHFGPPTVAVIDSTAGDTQMPLPDWDPEGGTGLVAQIAFDDSPRFDVDQLPQTLTIETDDDTYTYPHASLVKAFEIADNDGDGYVTQAEWRTAKNHNWPQIWYWPGVGAGVTLLFFWFGFREKIDAATSEKMADEAVLGAGQGPEPQVG